MVLTSLATNQTEAICEGGQIEVGTSVYTESGTYVDTLVSSTGCDSIVTTELTVLTSLTTNQTEAICEGGQVEVGTSVYTESGTYLDTLVSSTGCDSIITTELTVLTSLTTNQTESICEGGQVEVGTSIYIESGTYLDTLVASTGCDSIITTELTVVTSLTSNQTEMICEGGQVRVGTSVYTESGTYLDTLVASTGCDSIITTELTVATSLTSSQTETICEGGQLEVGSSVYTQAGTYSDTLVASSGCDSIVTTELTVAITLMSSQTEAICEGDQIRIGSSVYTESGTYSDTLVATSGCDSIVTTELTVVTSLTTNQTETICEGGQIQVGTSVYTENGTYLDTLVAGSGCDSIVTTELTVVTSLTTNQTETICEGGQIQVGSSVYTMSGTFLDTLMATSGCDSIVTTDLTVVTNITASRTDTLCEGAELRVGTSVYTESGTYLDTLVASSGCDSIITTDLTVLPADGLRAVVTQADPSCFGFADGRIQLTEVIGGVPPYVFSVNSLPPDSTYGGLTAGMYTYRLTDKFNCEDAGAVNLASPTLFTVDLGPNRTAISGETLSLPVMRTGEIATFELQPPTATCEPDCDRISLTPDSTVLLRLRAQDSLGCAASDSIRITVEIPRRIYIPNSFSPNGDGSNDRFTVFGESDYLARIRHLRIYNRWGGLVFERQDFSANDPSLGWDGLHGAKIAPIGPYVYSLEVEYADQETEHFGGGLMLVR